MEGWERKACETDSVCWTGEAYCAGGASCTSMVWCELVRLVRLVGLVWACKTCVVRWADGTCWTEGACKNGEACRLDGA